ncbi:MAG: CpsD/CapB family tyrosine-protein kinase, partial [Vicinamibacterales bacterium]
EEALRRAGKTVGRRESFNVPSTRALDWFPADGTAPAAGDAAAVTLETAPPGATAAAVLPYAPADLPLGATDGDRTPSADRIADPIRDPRDDASVPLDSVGAAEHCEKLIVNGKLPPAASEQYRRVAGLFHQLQRDRGIHVVMVASATPGEGKTLTSVNLALTFSESYRRRVLLIDADLRRPMLHNVLGVPNSPAGLSALLRSPQEYQLKTKHISDRLELAPSGAPDPDPMSSLSSERMRRIIADASTRYDWVIIDTPPVALLPDASLLAAMVDVAVLVIAAGRTPLAMVQKAVETIGRDKITGVVLNRVDAENIPGGAYEYGYYYAAAQEARG